MRNKGGQVTIFIIIGVILVAAVVGFFIFKDKLFQGNIPAELEPVYETFLSCLEEDLATGVDVLESQGGYIYLPDFEPGSPYMPFSNQLDFLGNPIPYWYYISGNNIQKTQVPSKGDMQEELAKFVEEQIGNCVYDSYYNEGFEVFQGTPSANVKISGKNVEVSLRMPMEISGKEESVKVTSHNLAIDSRLGDLYGAALDVYNYEQDTLFLETRGVDVLRSYAPVDGVEISCAPQTWDADEIFDELKVAIEANTLALKTKDNEYSLQKEENKYFVVDVSPGFETRFVNSRNWVYSYNVEPSEGNILLAKPVGNQPGVGIMGFCYVPYHFVYNLRYPVLVQVFDGSEFFQFPLAVVIQGNKEREAVPGAEAIDVGLPELCQYANTPVTVEVRGNNLESVDAEISYECFSTKCTIGKTENGVLTGNFPQCANGFVLAKADGYQLGKEIFSTVNSGSVEVFLDKSYEKQIAVYVDGVLTEEQALISFASEDSDAFTVVYPDTKTVELSEGQYEITVNVYRDSQLRLEATSQRECIDIPKPGIGGALGLTEEKCFDIEMPSQIVSTALSGGGTESYYISGSELEGSSRIELRVSSLPRPTTLEQLQENYVLFENKNIDVYFT